MTDVRCYPKAFITEFIELYKSLPCLWKVKSKEYNDRNKKNLAYRKMVAKLKEMDPSADRDSVIKKINSLRSSYRKEKRKTNESMMSGASEDDVHIPRLWYYHLLQFLDGEETQHGMTVSNYEESVSQEFITEQSVESVQETVSEEDVIEEGNTVFIGNENRDHWYTSRVSTSDYVPQAKKRKYETEECKERNDAAYTTQYERYVGEADECDLYGQLIATKLKKMDERSRDIAMNRIDNLLFEMKMKLNDQS
ncbi:uncharacterized protein LOC124711944 [Schistocerca piceifrons]|uniref:uncharacterized protein LOC124711944 n=1 Tax=Schistocerca piceifrons TaxID=274613 RepID=UPI001F5F7385|nr:uncharacterized protein LOC124711944 [Schistocerca piceifrons]